MAQADDEIPEVGTVLAGRYELQRRLGAGSLGVVFRAWDRTLEREAAVKVMPRTVGRSKEAATRFLVQARQASGLDHANIVPIYDIGRHQDSLFFVMKLLHGATLATRLRTDGPFAQADALTVAAEVLAGVDHLHQRGLVHGGLGLAAVLLEEGTGGRAVILDFGILRTPEWGEYRDPEGDLRAVGAMLYELLTGAPPQATRVVAPSPSNAEDGEPQRPSRPSPVPLRTRLPDVHPKVEALVERALAYSRDRRFDSARDMRESVEEAIALVATRADPTGRTTHDPEVNSRPRTGLRTAAGLVGMALAVAGLGGIWALDRHDEAGEGTTRRGPYTAAAEAATHALERARTSLAQGRASEAVGLFKEAVAGGDPRGFVGLGQAYERLGDRKAAAAAYHRYLELRPDSPDGDALRRSLRALESPAP